MKSKQYILIAFLLATGTAVMAQTPRITFKANVLYPEGVAYHPASSLYYVSSVKTGSIGSVDPLGNYKEVYRNKDLVSSFGMKIEPGTDKLWICLSDPDSAYSRYSSPETLKKMARVIAINVKSGKRVADIDLAKLYPGKHFANDLCFDNKGNKYITNSFSPVIYKIDAGGKATVFAENEMFKSDDIGLNGIVFHPAGYLLTVNNSDGAILKVPLSNPKEVTKVNIKGLFPGADGLLLDGQSNLVLIQNKGVNMIYKISSADDWRSAAVKESSGGLDRFQHPSTGVIKDGQVWVLNSKLNELSNPTLPPSKEFSLQLVQYKSTQ